MPTVKFDDGTKNTSSLFRYAFAKQFRPELRNVHLSGGAGNKIMGIWLWIPIIFVVALVSQEVSKSLLYQWFSLIKRRLLHHDHTICGRVLMLVCAGLGACSTPFPRPTGQSETQKAWRQARACLCVAKFAENRFDRSIGRRSFVRPGARQIPIRYKGHAVRAMGGRHPS